MKTVKATDALEIADHIVNKFPQIEQFVLKPMLKREIAKAILNASEDGYDAGRTITRDKPKARRK